MNVKVRLVRVQRIVESADIWVENFKVSESYLADRQRLAEEAERIAEADGADFEAESTVITYPHNLARVVEVEMREES